jgi:hypothetical protein
MVVMFWRYWSVFCVLAVLIRSSPAQGLSCSGAALFRGRPFRGRPVPWPSRSVAVPFRGRPVLFCLSRPGCSVLNFLFYSSCPALVLLSLLPSFSQWSSLAFPFCFHVLPAMLYLFLVLAQNSTESVEAWNSAHKTPRNEIFIRQNLSFVKGQQFFRENPRFQLMGLIFWNICMYISCIQQKLTYHNVFERLFIKIYDLSSTVKIYM